MKPISPLVKASALYALPETTLPYYVLGDYHPPHSQEFKVNAQKLLWIINARPLSTALQLIISLKFLAHIGAGLAVILLLMSLMFQPAFYFDSSYPYLALLSVLIYYIADVSYYGCGLSQRVAVTLHRDTGIIEIPTPKQGNQQLNFETTCASLSNQLYGIEEAYTYLLLQNPANKKSYPIYKHKSELKLKLLWSFIRHYMDNDTPLPDVPALEPYRRFDPVTRDYDQTTQRNPNYWRSKTQSQVIELVETIQVHIR